MEIMHSMQNMKNEKGDFIIKVELSKAYHKVSWDFILRVLWEVQFQDNIINLIMHVVTSVETNGKWNGERN